MSPAPPSPPEGATARLAVFATQGVRQRDPATARALGGLVVDTVGVAVAGMSAPPATILRSWLDDQAHDTSRSSGAAVWGTERRLGAADAALLNGTAAHALDWDDAAPSMAMHPAAVLLPTLFALAAGRAVTGAQLDAAYCVGSAVFRAVSEVLPHAVHYGRGWHNTSTTGRLAATAAGASLVGLPPALTQHALGIAASHAAGSLANFGTMTKPMHAGAAARDAVLSLGLAAGGFTSNPDQLEARGGFFDLFGEHEPGRVAELEDRLHHWSSAWVDDYAIKAHPSCFATQRAIDAALSLRAELGGDTDQVDQILVTLEHGGTRPLRDSFPSTGLEAKFSLQYTVARALASGHVLLSDFSDDFLADPAVEALMRRITLSQRPEAPGAGFTTFELRTRDGRTLNRTVRHARGESTNPLSRAELAAKFAQCVGADRATGWLEALHDLPASDSPVDLQPLLAGPGAV